MEPSPADSSARRGAPTVAGGSRREARQKAAEADVLERMKGRGQPIPGLPAASQASVNAHRPGPPARAAGARQRNGRSDAGEPAARAGDNPRYQTRDAQGEVHQGRSHCWAAADYIRHHLPQVHEKALSQHQRVAIRNRKEARTVRYERGSSAFLLQMLVWRLATTCREGFGPF
jgi:hypothetical protein